MMDYSTLRERMLMIGSGWATVRPEMILAMLDELGELRAKVKPAKVARNEYLPAFDEVWAAYPPRENANKRKAFGAWSARINERVATADMLAGVKRYAAYVLAERKEERYTLQPATFFGPDEYYLQQWASAQKGKSNGQIGKQDYSAGVQDDGSF